MTWPFDKLKIMICGGSKVEEEEIQRTMAKHAAAAKRFNEAIAKAALENRSRLFGEELLGNHHNATDT